MANTEQVKPQIKVTVIKGKENILKSITQVSVQGKALETLLHTVAVSVLMHIEKHREVSLANKLIEAVPNLARKNALRDWFTTFGKCVYDAETKTLAFKKTGKTNQPEATQNPFWTFKPEAEYVPYDLDAVLLKVIKTAETKMDQGNKQDKIDKKKLATLKTLIAA